jgi:hypothetical protein
MHNSRRLQLEQATLMAEGFMAGDLRLDYGHVGERRF